jgi:hypothetical protein
MSGKVVMRRRTYAVINVVVFTVMIVLLTCCGVLMGTIQEWPRMGMHFFLVVFLSECFVCVLLNHKIESYFMQMQVNITGKPASDKLGSKFVPNSIFIPWLIFVVAIPILSMLAGEYRRWLIMSMLLTIFLITSFVFTAISVWLKVKACTKWLEEMVSKNREGEARAERGEL